MGPINPLYTPPPPRNVWDRFYFVPGTCPNMKSGCRRHQIGMDYLWDAIFKMAAIEISGIIFSPVTQFLGDRDKILVFKPIFMWMRNPMITLKSPYDSWLTQNSKWLPSKPAEITLISQWAQYWQYAPHVPARNVRKLCYFITGTYSNMKSRCRHH